MGITPSPLRGTPCIGARYVEQKVCLGLRVYAYMYPCLNCANVRDALVSGDRAH